MWAPIFLDTSSINDGHFKAHFHSPSPHRASNQNHLPKMAVLPNPVNTELKQGFTVPQVAEKHACPVGPEDHTGGWAEPLVWPIALEGKDDLQRFKELNWGLRTWDLWNWNDIDQRFGDEWPGRIPAQMIAHILYYFSDQNDLVFDPTRLP